MCLYACVKKCDRLKVRNIWGAVSGWGKKKERSLIHWRHRKLAHVTTEEIAKCSSMRLVW